MELEQKALPRTLWAEGCAPYRNYTITFAGTKRLQPPHYESVESLNC